MKLFDKNPRMFSPLRGIRGGLLLIALLLCGTAAAQEVRFAYVDADSVMRAMPAYAETQKQLADLRAKYEQEVQYNEQAFQRQFSEFLDGQKDFPEPILLKRQRDLQDAMEKGLAFRRECDRLLRRAEREMLAPLRQQVNEVIAKIGTSGDYAFILPAKPLFANPGYCDDVTALAISKINEKN